MSLLGTSLLDSLVNFVTGLGTRKDASTASHFLLHILNRNELENMYRSNWMARAGVDCPAEDATREWRSWQGSDKQIDAIEALERRFQLQMKMRQALIRANLYGGAALVLGVDQGEPEEELDFDTVGKDDLKFVVVLNRYELNAGPRIYNVMSRWYTRPEYYTISTPLFGWNFEGGDVYPTGKGKNPNPTPERFQGQMPSPLVQEESDYNRQVIPAQGLVRIHPSRVIEFWGNELPDWRLAPMGGGWGDSVIQTAEDSLKQFGTSIAALASMMNDAKMDVIKIPNLSQALAHEATRSKLIERFMLANQTKSMINTLLLDKEEEWERIQTNLSGAPPVVDKLSLLCSAAFKTPMSRMIGGAPSGALSTAGGSGGEVDVKNYYDRISSMQRNIYTPIMEPLDQCLIRSALGSFDKNIQFTWSPLYKSDPLEEAQVNKFKADTTQVYVTTGLFNEDMLRTAALNQIQEDDLYPGIEDAIDEFGEEPDLDDIAAKMQMMQPAQAPTPGKPAAGKPTPGKTAPKPTNPMAGNKKPTPSKAAPGKKQSSGL